MSDKKFILNADDFGMSEAFNRAVLEGYSSGILKSASLVANGDAFNEAWKNVIPSCPNLGVGVHLLRVPRAANAPDGHQWLG